MVNIAVNNTPSPGSGTDQTPFYTGTQRPLLKHKDKQGSTEHHRGRRGGSAGQGGSSPEMVEALAVQISGISEGVGNDLADQGMDIDSPEYDRELAKLTFEDPEVEAMLDDELNANNLDIEGPAREQLKGQLLDSLGFSGGSEPTSQDPTGIGPYDEGMSPEEVEGGSAPNEIDTEGQYGPDAPGTEPGSYWRDRGVQPDRKTSRSQTTLSNMFRGLGKMAIGQQTPILEKHKDSQGSTEHHKSKDPDQAAMPGHRQPTNVGTENFPTDPIHDKRIPAATRALLTGRRRSKALRKHKDKQGSTEHHHTARNRLEEIKRRTGSYGYDWREDTDVRVEAQRVAELEGSSVEDVLGSLEEKHKDKQGSTAHHGVKQHGTQTQQEREKSREMEDRFAQRTKEYGREGRVAPKLLPPDVRATKQEVMQDARSLGHGLPREVRDQFNEDFKFAQEGGHVPEMQEVLDTWKKDPWGAGKKVQRSVTKALVASTETILSLHDTPGSPHSEHGKKKRTDIRGEFLSKPPSLTPGDEAVEPGQSGERAPGTDGPPTKLDPKDMAQAAQTRRRGRPRDRSYYD